MKIKLFRLVIIWFLILIVQISVETLYPGNIFRNVWKRESLWLDWSFHRKNVNIFRHYSDEYPTIFFFDVKAAAHVSGLAFSRNAFSFKRLSFDCANGKLFRIQKVIFCWKKRWSLPKTSELKIENINFILIIIITFTIRFTNLSNFSFHWVRVFWQTDWLNVIIEHNVLREF